MSLLSALSGTDIWAVLVAGVVHMATWLALCRPGLFEKA
jgi:hypothetical protein